MTEESSGTLHVHDDIDLTNIQVLRNLLYAHHMRPNKAFGQNFLVDRAVLRRIVEAAEVEQADQVLEVGAGTGVLTRELARLARRVVRSGNPWSGPARTNQIPSNQNARQ